MQTLYNKLDEAIDEMQSDNSIPEEVQEQLAKLVIKNKDMRMNIRIKQDKVKATTEKLNEQKEVLSDYIQRDFLETATEIFKLYFNSMPEDKAFKFLPEFVIAMYENKERLESK